jgi:hypothetical protein
LGRKNGKDYLTMGLERRDPGIKGSKIGFALSLSACALGLAIA